jgi:hypothetical protein
MGRSVSFRVKSSLLIASVVVFLGVMLQGGRSESTGHDPTVSNAAQLVTQGRQIFRFDTFGDQTFWGDTLKLHQAMEGAALGGVGPGVSPKTALTVGLKIDVDALPSNLLPQLQHGNVNLNDPAVTVALLKLNAVVGVTGGFRFLRSTSIHGDSVRVVPFHGRQFRTCAMRRRHSAKSRHRVHRAPSGRLAQS